MANHQTTTVMRLRQMILDGEIQPGEVLAEIPLAERFGVSRTPVRHALAVLEQEGLLTRDQSRSYTVKSFTAAEIADAIEVRGVIEGLAARLVAEHGVSRGLSRDLKSCLAEGDAILDGERVASEDHERYNTMNARFHKLIVEGSGSVPLEHALAVNDKLPFASAEAFAMSKTDPREEYRRFLVAHLQHHAIVEALEAGESSRAESLMREHAQLAKRHMAIMEGARISFADAGSQLSWLDRESA